MRILSYQFRGTSKNDLRFSRVDFGRLNLLVGDSGTGKTKLLNTIFNGAQLVTQENRFFFGDWDMRIEQKGQIYRWAIKTEGEEGEKPRVTAERIYKLENGDETVIVERNADSFVFDGNVLPKLSPAKSSISLLQDEEWIQPLHEGLSSILRRDFSSSALDEAASFQSVPSGLLKRIEKTKNLDELFASSLNLNGKLYVLSLYFEDVYERICTEFKTVFPFVTNLRLFDSEHFGLHTPVLVPVFALKEETIEPWIPLNEFSSGMRKVLLILTDIFTLPADGGVYLIDEYENSLGINAINFFPSILLEVDTPSQFIVTSHHPYIIGSVPVKDWFILHRKGLDVAIQYGQELEQRLGKSKQQAFIQLINDPFYSEGIE